MSWALIPGELAETPIQIRPCRSRPVAPQMAVASGKAGSLSSRVGGAASAGGRRRPPEEAPGTLLVRARPPGRVGAAALGAEQDWDQRAEGREDCDVPHDRPALEDPPRRARYHGCGRPGVLTRIV
jgi:hypothetical protein